MVKVPWKVPVMIKLASKQEVIIILSTFRSGRWKDGAANIMFHISITVSGKLNLIVISLSINRISVAGMVSKSGENVH